MARYCYESCLPGPGEVAITPLVGMGKDSHLNVTILALVKSARKRLVIYTPYFNLPDILRRALSRQLARGREVAIVVGDRTANDFCIPPSEPFKVIGLLPYLYEANLRRFAKAQRQAIADGRLKIYLWRHADNTHHLKGLLKGQHDRELASILKHATRLASFRELETPSAYPPKVQQDLKRLKRVRIDRLLNGLL